MYSISCNDCSNKDLAQRSMYLETLYTGTIIDTIVLLLTFLRQNISAESLSSSTKKVDQAHPTYYNKNQNKMSH